MLAQESIRKEAINDFEREVTLGIFKAATLNNKMLV